MTKDEYLRRAAEITSAWNRRYADQIESAYPLDSRPHNGVDTDYAQHHALMSAPPEYADILEEKLHRLTQEYHASQRG